MYWMTYSALLIVEEFQDVDSLIKLGLTTIALMTNRVLIIYRNVIGFSFCGKNTLDAGVMLRPSVKRHTQNIITVFLNLSHPHKR